MAIFRHSRQLHQLEVLNPTAHRKAKRFLALGKTNKAIGIILEAMHAALSNLAGPEPTPAQLIWIEIECRVEAQDFPLWRNTQIEIGQVSGYTVSLYRRSTDDQIVLYHPVLGASAPVARWGRDLDPNNQSSAYNGCWKLTKAAKRNLEAWLNPAPSLRSQPRWSGRGWGRK